MQEFQIPCVAAIVYVFLNPLGFKDSPSFSVWESFALRDFCTSFVVQPSSLTVLHVYDPQSNSTIANEKTFLWNIPSKEKRSEIEHHVEACNIVLILDLLLFGWSWFK